MTTLPNLLRVHVLLQELVVVLNGVDILAKVTKQIVQEEVEGLQEVAVVLNILDDFSIRHALFDSTIIAVLQKLVYLKHVDRLLIIILLLNLHYTVLNELHPGELLIDLDVADELLSWSYLHTIKVVVHIMK